MGRVFEQKIIYKVVCLVCALYCNSLVGASLLTMSEFKYEGAFRLPGDIYGDSRLGFENGNFALAPDGKSIFITGSAGSATIAEFKIPTNWTNSTVLSDLVMSPTPVQNFKKIIPKAPSGNPQELSNITGLEFYDGSLFVNLAKYYDASASVTHTTIKLLDPNNLSETSAEGFFTIEGKVHSAGWFSEIPAALSQELNANTIVGHASNLPINGRNSIGPTAFTIDQPALSSAKMGDVVDSTVLLDYSINRPLHDDLYNTEGGNDLWTEISKAHYGFIVPGTRTYLIVGSSGGHESGLGYKITQDNGTICGGACPYKVADQYSYVWMYNVDDLIKVKNGVLKPEDPRPYLYGKLDIPFQPTDPTKRRYLVSGADFDPSSGLLYLLVRQADTLQSQFEKKPIVIVYSFEGAVKPDVIRNLDIEINHK